MYCCIRISQHDLYVSSAVREVGLSVGPFHETLIVLVQLLSFALLPVFMPEPLVTYSNPKSILSYLGEMLDLVRRKMLLGLLSRATVEK